MIAPQTIQLGAILILVGLEPEEKLKHPLDMSRCGVAQVQRQANLIQTRMIVGGNVALEGAWPWQIAVLDRRRRLVCGGTLISDEFVLTAAHCVTSRMQIVAGEFNLNLTEGYEQERGVARIFKHPRYNETNVHNDIALLKLDSPLELNSRVWPACLPEANEELKPSLMATILGWGVISYRQQPVGQPPDYDLDECLNKASVPVVDFDECVSSYGSNLESHQVICAGYKEGRIDSCAGDSGGPLLLERDGRWLVYGVTSFGDGCGMEGKYGIYSKVSAYVPWIRSVVGRHSSSSRSAIA